jgi:hypothetical protein
MVREAGRNGTIRLFVLFLDLKGRVGHRLGWHRLVVVVLSFFTDLGHRVEAHFERMVDSRIRRDVHDVVVRSIAEVRFNELV